ncbi:calpain-A-like isoform X3 [Lytechinus variegatus]|uniref:calpain-A-like isoform X3 n=1 Tax=Lytechinus variegatus TaxID=7654 RepID=UPI001BB2BE5C|nr:calpain-A-like isoform X3 [Lytechinus variegatus]
MSSTKKMIQQGSQYDQLLRQCRSSGTLFEDPYFPAVDESIFYTQKPPRPFVWKRPRDICANPQLFVGGTSRFDVEQGQLGDCWFLAATAGLSLDDYLLQKVIPPDQNFNLGIVKFNFWYYGKWITIVVDDRLPTYNDKLVFVHSKDQNEFWSALLEKAYAKLHGSYECLKGGNVIEAMEDFTGGVSESIELKQNPPKNLFRVLKIAYDRDSQLGCSINAKPGETEAKVGLGLIAGHAYTITDVQKAKFSSGREVKLIRIRNPWGQGEWEGAWSDGSNEWRNVSQQERTRLGLVSNDDGEFWMEFSDFMRYYDRVDICHLGADTMTGKKKKKWQVTSHDGKWQRGCTAGGCRNFPDTFWINPQIELVLEEEDDDDDFGDGEEDPVQKGKGSTFLVALMQKNRREMRKMGVDNLTCGFAIYQVDGSFNASVGLPKDHFLYNASTARSPTFTNTREVSGRFKLPPGRYVILPSTFEPNQEGDFLLRIFSMKVAKGVTVNQQSSMDIKPQQNVKAASDPYVAPSAPVKPLPAQDEAQTAKFREFFKKLTGDDMEVDAWELQEILNAALKREELQGGGFSLESCKSMVALTDDDRSGKLGFEEFRELWQNISVWKAVFKKYDTDNSGTFNGYELRSALTSLGFKLSNETFSALILRYADKRGMITFDSFIGAAIKLKYMFTSYSSSRGNFGLDEFLMLSLYS